MSSTGQALQVYPPLGQRRIQYRHADDAQSADRAERALGDQHRERDSEPAGEFDRPTVAPFDPTNRSTYNQSTSTTVYDSLGNSYPATFYFTQTAAPNQWNVNMTVNGTAGRRAHRPLTFSSTGAVTAPVSGALAFNGFAPPDGARR